jgi:UDP-GlcNAc3NAcA epimerase
MSAVFFEELGIQEPDHHLGIGSGSHGEQTGRMLQVLERVMQDEDPAMVLVYGDTNSTLAGALAAAKLHVPVAHVEAGMRSFNRRMPEEINRVLTDHLSTLLLVPTRAAFENLAIEGIAGDAVHLVGDVMYDAALHHKQIALERSSIVERLGLESGAYALATVHRAENTDDGDRLEGVMEGLSRISGMLPVVLPMHPRTRQVLARNGMLEEVAEQLLVVEPVGYMDMVRLESGAALVVTDSGGVQKEAYFFGVHCLTLRDETEWVELVEIGANVLVSADPDAIERAATDVLGSPSLIETSDLYGQGNAGKRIHDILAGEMERA